MNAANSPLKPTQFLELSGGARLAYEEYGDPAGEPVVFCHGWPGSRLQGTSCAAAAREAGVRIISPDRPGIGLSTFHPNRELLDWPPVLAALADKLGFDQFRVMGLSGGAPYTFAAAARLPERIPAIAVISGAPPLPVDLDGQALFGIYRWLLGLHRRQPAVLRGLFWCARPVATIRPPRWLRPWLLNQASKADAETLSAPGLFEEHYEGYREAWRGSADGVVTDAEIYSRDWGFRLEDLRTPVRLWHGKEDRNFSWKLAEQVAKRLPNCEARYLDGEGHYSLPIRFWAEILRDLRKA
ncbi:MAG TPA: alpha/beta hydrolase [Chthoniobacteraceae bacterium]